MFTIKTDSKKINYGDTFIAIKGFTKDGHGYIEDAIKNGATKVIVEYGEYEVETLKVKDTKKYLERYLYKTYKDILNKMCIIGITGTNGKTTTGFLIYQMLNKLGTKCSYIGTIGYYKKNKVTDLINTSPDITTLYELLVDSYENGYYHVVVEASSQGLIHDRFGKLEFNYGIFTNLTQDHLDYHVTMYNYAMAKQKMFYRIKDKAIVNIDDPNSNYFLLDQNTNITYGLKGEYKIGNYEITPKGMKFIYNYKNEAQRVITSLLGKHNIYNLIATISLVNEMGYYIKDINRLCSKLQAPPGRMDSISYNNKTIIIDYAHTPDAVEHILNTVASFCQGYIYTVFGCTGNRDRKKRPIMTKLILDSSKETILTTDDLHYESFKQILNDMLENNHQKNYMIIEDRKEAIIRGINLLKDRDILLILGKGHESVQITGNERKSFSDKKVVIEYLNNVKINT